MKIICDSEEQKKEVSDLLMRLCPYNFHLEIKGTCRDWDTCEQCWLNSGLELVLEKDEPKIAYLCDQKECVACINPDCHHTTKITNAVNFENLGDNHYMEKEK